MIQSPEARIEQLEKAVRELSNRVSALEYAAMTKHKDQWPTPMEITCKPPLMGYAQ